MLIGSGIDETVGDERARLGGGARFCDANLYATLPLLAIITFMLFRLIAQAENITLLGPALASDAKDSWPVLGAAYGTGYFYAIPGAAVAHELTHRNTSNLALICARILYALTLNPTFETTHAHGHHRNVGTYCDYATARRGEYVLAFVVRTVTYQSIEGWQAEVKQLRRNGFNIWSWRNACSAE
jgi:alkane 1-monooxygenase